MTSFFHSPKCRFCFIIVMWKKVWKYKWRKIGYFKLKQYLIRSQSVTETLKSFVFRYSFGLEEKRGHVRKLMKFVSFPHWIWNFIMEFCFLPSFWRAFYYPFWNEKHKNITNSFLNWTIFFNQFFGFEQQPWPGLTKWLADENGKRTEKSSSTRNLPHFDALTHQRWGGGGVRRASPSGKVEAKTS